MSPKFITRKILVVSLVSLFTDVASEMLYPVMPVYLKSIGFSVILIGVLEGLAEAIAGFSKGYFGKLSDLKNSRIPFIRAGYTMSAFSKPMMAVFTAPWWIFLSRSLDRLGKGVRTSARDALLSDESTPENKGKVFGFHRAMDTLGAAIGPICALVFLSFFPARYALLFFLAFFPGMVAVLLTFLIRENKAGKSTTNRGGNFFGFLSYWKTAPRQYRLLVIGLLAFTLFNSSDAFILLIIKEKGFSDSAMIGFYIFYNIGYALLSFPVGILADKVGLRRILLAGLVAFSITYSLISFAGGMVFFGIVFMVYAFFAAATEGISKALISNICDKKDTATAMGFYNAFSSIITLVSSSLAGLLWFGFSPRFMFLFSATGAFLVIIYLTVIFTFFKHKNLSYGS